MNALTPPCAAALLAALTGTAMGDGGASPAPDLSRPTLFVVGYAHLDTQWRWTYVDTLREFIPDTLHGNFALFEQFPGYVFNFGGSRRYEMMREYYPDDYQRLKAWIAAGRWFPCGSSVDENDSNVPSAESIVRHVLYGNEFFRAEFGVASDEYMLPDCFGFPASLPSVLAHCGILGFSTQKLTWNSVVPIPFKVGVWEGPDGRSVIAALDPGAYVGEVRANLATDDGWYQRLENNGRQSGVYVDYHYYGTGDQGGAPRASSVSMVEQSVRTSAEPGARIKVISGPADAMVHAITPEQRAALPTYTGELELTQHSAGSVSSQASMKRWNRKNELLADAAEKASVAAWWMGGRPYPDDKLQDAWELVLGSQMHDILPGTSVPRAYDYAWNDEIIASNLFGSVLTNAASSVIAAMDTRVGDDAACIVVYNPLAAARQDVVEAEVPSAGTAAGGVLVTGPDGASVPAQLLDAGGGMARVAFLADAPSVGFASYAVQLTARAQPAAASALTIRDDGRRLENAAYVVELDDHGDVSSIYDKRLRRELLSAPATLGLYYENPGQWPAWNQDWDDRIRPARSFAGAEGPVAFKVVERGPARVAVEVTRTAEGSTFTQRIRLAAGEAAGRVEFDTRIEWRSRERSLRAAFPLTAASPQATYDIQVGTLSRGNGHESQYEYLFHQWFDLTDAGGRYGVSVLCDSKYGCDKPSDDIVRLTLLHTPGTRGGYPDQGTQDLGRHEVLYALVGHAGDWRAGRSYLRAAGLNQPLIPFRASAHAGALGKSFSLVRVSTPAVGVAALKKAEAGDEVIVRLREHSGRDARGVRVDVGPGRSIVSAREVDGQERPLGAARVRDGQLIADVGAYELRAYALRLGPAPVALPAVVSEPVRLPFDTDVISPNGDRGDGAIVPGRSLPAEQFPASVTDGGVTFTMGPTGPGQMNALAGRGQEIHLPGGDFDRLYLLAAATGGDVSTALRVDGRSVPVTVQRWSGFIGQWDRREWPGDVDDPRYPWGGSDPIGLSPGFVKPGTVAWHCSHHHSTAGGGDGADVYYHYSYLFRIGLDLPAGTRTVTLPDDPRVKVFAAAVAREGPARAEPARPLFDTLADHVQDAPRIAPLTAASGPDEIHTDSVDVAIGPNLYWGPGSFRYTTDGSRPTAHSPVYRGPLTIGAPTTVTAAAVAADGAIGPVASATITVRDRTPPTVTHVQGMFRSRTLRVDFTEPVSAAAGNADRYSISPSIGVTGATLGDDARSVELTLSRAPDIDRVYALQIGGGLPDLSPGANEMTPASVSFTVPGPVFSMETVGADQKGRVIREPGLPTGAGDSWTLNVFARMDRQPTNHTILAGFGRCDAPAGGQGRYLCKFAGGVHFWSHNQDCPSRTPYDLGRWQMITAVYDGAMLRLYRDGKQIGARPIRLSDDEGVVQIAPIDPWDHRYQFDGDLAGLTIWNTPLNELAIEALLANGPG